MSQEQRPHNPQEGSTPEPFNIDQARQELASLRPRTPEAMAQALRQHFIPFAVEAMTTLDQRATFLTYQALEESKQMNIPPGPFVSRQISKAVVQEASTLLKGKAVEAYNNGDVGAFNALYDAAHGVALSVSELPIAELTEDMFNNTLRTAYAVHTEQIDTTIPTDAKQAALDGVKQFWQEASQHLVNDPSGVSLVATSIERTHTNFAGERSVPVGMQVQSYQIPEFVFAGAELGKQIYTTTYALAQEQSSLPQ